MTYSQTTGSRRVDRDDRGGLRKPLPLLLLLLVAVLGAAFLVSMISDDDSGGNSDSSQLISGEVGKAANGKDVVVQSVNGNEGFFVGSSTTDRVYVEWGGDIGANEASQFQPKKGDAVNLTGPVQAAGAEQLRKLKLSAEDRELVQSQGAFVNADRVTKAE